MSKKLPKGWNKSKLIDLCDFSQGIQVAIDNQYNEREEGYVRFLRIVDYTQNKDELRYIIYPGDKYMVNSSEVVMIRYGDAGRVVRGHEGAIANNLFKITPKLNHLTNDYLYYFLSQNRIYDMLINSQQKTGLPAVNFRTVYDIEIVYPETLEEQKRIASILEKAEKTIEKREESIKLLDEYLKSVFVDMFGDPVNNPKRWEIRKLKDISTKILSGNTPKGGSQVYVEDGIMFLRSQNVWKNKLELDDVAYIDQQTHDKMAKSSLKNRDILMTKTGRINTENSSLGRAAMYRGEDDSANINGHVYLIRLKEDIVNEFVLYILTSNEYREYIRSVCVGGIDKRQINKEHLEEFPIIFPPAELQKQFVDFVKQADKLKFEMENSLKELSNNFNSLMQKAFNGEL